MNAKGQCLVIRADASAEIGSGHVMRCLALAQAWQRRGGRAIFAIAHPLDVLKKRLRSEGSDVVEIETEPGSEEDAWETSEVCRRNSALWLVVDGYHFSPAYHSIVARGTWRLLLVDDDGECSRYECDLVLNMNPQASDATYRLRKKKTQLLLGARYALVREEFLKFKKKRSAVPEQARRILLTLGGADDQNVTLRVLRALDRIDDNRLEITVIAGANNPNGESLRTAVNQSCHDAKLVYNVKNMPEYMAKADLAIAAGGGTCFELSFMKVPMFLLTIAKNQQRTVEAYGESRAAIAGGWFSDLTRDALASRLSEVIGDRTLREKLKENAGRLVDGRGAQRVVEEMRLRGRSRPHARQTTRTR